MAAQDKKIGSLTEWLYSNIVDAANIVVAHAGENYRVAMSAIRQYVLGNRVINGTDFGDIPTNGGEQTLLNKRLDEPAFNSDTQLSYEVTATQMNHLRGLDVNVKQKFNNLDLDIFGIENNIYNLLDAVNALQADKIYSAGIGTEAGVSSIKINASSISGDKINPYSLSISVYEQISLLTMKLLNPSDIDILISNDFLSSITIAEVLPGKTYRIVIRYRLLDE